MDGKIFFRTIAIFNLIGMLFAYTKGNTGSIIINGFCVTVMVLLSLDK